MLQLKEQERSLEKELYKTEARYLPDTGFRILVIRMLKGLWLVWLSGLSIGLRTKGSPV